MKLLPLLLCSLLMVAAGAEDGEDPSPRVPDAVRQAAAAELEAYAAELAQREAAKAALTDEHRALLAAIEVALLEADAALDAGRGLQAGGHYLTLQEQLDELPAEIRLALPERVAAARRAFLALTRRILAAEDLAPDPGEDQAAPATDLPGRSSEPERTVAPEDVPAEPTDDPAAGDDEAASATGAAESDGSTAELEAGQATAFP